MPEIPESGAVIVKMDILRTVPALSRTLTMTARMTFPGGVPREGDRIELAPGWAAHPVRQVIWRDGYEPVVYLHTVETRDAERLVEFGRLIETRRWECPDWPWQRDPMSSEQGDQQ